MKDLESLANDNALLLRDWQNSMSFSDLHNAFIGFVEQCVHVSLNTRVASLERILSDEEITNMYEKLASEKKMLEELWETQLPSHEDMLKHSFRAFYQKRIAFDAMFQSGLKFIYTALNSSGLGLAKYGDFCLNFNRHSLRIVFLAKESLKYFLPKGDFDYEGFTSEVCLNNMLAALVLKKHLHELNPGLDFQQICKETDYIEGIVLDKLSTDYIEHVTISRNAFKAYYELYTKQFTEELTPYDKTVLSLFTSINKTLTKKQIKLKVVDNLTGI